MSKDKKPELVKADFGVYPYDGSNDVYEIGYWSDTENKEVTKTVRLKDALTSLNQVNMIDLLRILVHDRQRAFGLELEPDSMFEDAKERLGMK